MNASKIQQLVSEALELDRTQEKEGKPVMLPKSPEGWMPPGKRRRIISIIEAIGKEAAQ